jgi:hypothetical protein
MSQRRGDARPATVFDVDVVVVEQQKETVEMTDGKTDDRQLLATSLEERCGRNWQFTMPYFTNLSPGSSSVSAQWR